uniref:Uncharacterized protein n=1 Tax=Lactuca sativa TaxID=4236 RepID=A0A9R1UET1_LACSA|nr:hypothetical protein LSAT_V11C900469490 [Lactuca sativa]
MKSKYLYEDLTHRSLVQKKIGAQEVEGHGIERVEKLTIELCALALEVAKGKLCDSNRNLNGEANLKKGILPPNLGGKLFQETPPNIMLIVRGLYPHR